MFYDPKLCEEFLYLGQRSLCLWKECILYHVRIYSINDRLHWLAVCQCVSSHLYFYCSFFKLLLFQPLKRLLLKSLMALPTAYFILVTFASCIWSHVLVCQCVDCCLSAAVVLWLLLVSNNIPCPSLRALRRAWAGSRVGSVDPFVACL